MESRCAQHETGSGDSLLILHSLRRSAMRVNSRTFSLSTGVLMLLGGAAWLCARALPKCTHGEKSYSFPITVDGKTTRTCYKCGHSREYDMTTMRFLTGHFVSASEK
ncbi:MAG: hypothetical protein ACXV5J_08630 [Candidatus Angelobacter sp.]